MSAAPQASGAASDDSAPGAGPDPGPHLAACAAAAVAGAEAALAAALDAALAAGVAPTALREALLMLAPFAGYPRTLDALSALRAAFGRAPAGSAPAVESGLPADPGVRAELFRARGRALFARVYGADAERVLGRLEALDAELPAWVLESAYGRVLARPGLDLAQRERVAVVLLAAQGLVQQLPGHVHGALRAGATAADVRASLDAAAALVPRAARDVAERALLRAAR